MTTTLPSSTTLRQADLNTLMTVLNEQHARAIDVVIPGSRISVSSSIFELTGLDGIPTEDGVVDPNGLYSPTTVAIEGISSKLGVPLPWLKWMRTERPDLYEDTVGGLLAPSDLYPKATFADKKFLLRLFRSDDSPTGVLRAFLSDRFDLKRDNLDTLLAALQGIIEAGVEDPVIEADLTERRMIVRVHVPSIAVHADKLLENYRSPFDGSDVGNGWTPERVRRVSQREGQQIEGGGKLVFAGLVISNSEVGNGRFSITPQIKVQVCDNGLSFTADAVNKPHLGTKLEEGIVKWSEDTEKANLALVTKQTADAVRTFLDVEYVTKKVADLEKAGAEKVTDAPEVIAHVSKKLAFNDAQQKTILAHFYRGGLENVFGVTQAITSASQLVDDGDTAFEMDNLALSAMAHAREANKILASK